MFSRPLYLFHLSETASSTSLDLSQTLPRTASLASTANVKTTPDATQGIWSSVCPSLPHPVCLLTLASCQLQLCCVWLVNVALVRSPWGIYSSLPVHQRRVCPPPVTDTSVTVTMQFQTSLDFQGWNGKIMFPFLGIQMTKVLLSNCSFRLVDYTNKSLCSALLSTHNENIPKSKLVCKMK